MEKLLNKVLNCCRITNDEHSSKCVDNCDIYSLKYGKRRQGMVNVDEYSSLCSALVNTFTTYKHAIVILRNATLAIFSASDCSFYTFDPHARNSDGMPYSHGTATVLKFGYQYSCCSMRIWNSNCIEIWISKCSRSIFMCFSKWNDLSLCWNYSSWIK